MTHKAFEEMIDDIQKAEMFSSRNVYYLIVDGNQYKIEDWNVFLEWNDYGDVEEFVFYETKGSWFYYDLALVQGIRIVKEPEPCQ